MSRQLISSEKFPTKPHNCPATKVPGLVFCAGQTATGEIKQATVSLPLKPAIKAVLQHLLIHTTEKGPPKSEGSARIVRVITRAGSQVQCLSRRHEGLRRNERGVYRIPAPANAIAVMFTGPRSW